MELARFVPQYSLYPTRVRERAKSLLLQFVLKLEMGRGKLRSRRGEALSLPLAWGEALNHSGLVDGVITLSVSHRCSHED